jgi:hypothetical protein
VLAAAIESLKAKTGVGSHDTRSIVASVKGFGPHVVLYPPWEIGKSPLR